MNAPRRSRFSVALAAVAAAVAWTVTPDASACGPDPEQTMREAVVQRISTMSESELRGLLARLERDARLAQARAAERARAAAGRQRLSSR